MAWRRSDAEIDALREEVVRLNAENVVLRTRLSEYLSIKGEGGVPPEQVVVVRGRIVSRTQRAGRRFCELDVGAIDGVVKGLPACSGWSLMGVVVGVQAGRCLVQEVCDTESRITAAVMDGAKPEARRGIVLTGNGHPRQLVLDDVEVQEGVEIGPRHAGGDPPAGTATCLRAWSWAGRQRHPRGGGRALADRGRAGAHHRERRVAAGDPLRLGRAPAGAVSRQ